MTGCLLRMMDQDERRLAAGKAMSSGWFVQDRTSDPIPAAAPPIGPNPAVVSLAPSHRHRLKPLEGKPAGTLLVHEIYRSLQGESTFAGLPCIFIRLTVCHLR